MATCIICAGSATSGQGTGLPAKDEAKIKQLLSKMTLEEKCTLLHANSKFRIGAIKRLGIPEWTLSDGPHGVRAEINRDNWNYTGQTDDSSTYMPTGTALAATWNRDIAFVRGQALGEEARARGKDVLLGPGMNIIRTPLCGRNFEYLSEDPYLNAQMAVPYVKGLQSKDVAASIKHYAANNQEINRGTVDVSMSERAFREIYLPAFKAAIQDGDALTVMCAYNKFRGDWCSENSYLGRTVLRDELGFKGVFMSDWDAVHSTVKAANAGLDLEMGTEIKDYNQWYFAKPLVDAVKRGEVSEATVNEKVANILRVILRTKVLEPNARAHGAFNTKEHQQVAYNTACESIVLLKNDGGTLPFDFTNLKSVAVIGDNATRKHSNGGLSSEIKALYEVTPFEALQRKFGTAVNLAFAQGYAKQSKSFEEVAKGTVDYNKVDWVLIDEAVALAKKSDVAFVFCGLNHDFDTESTDKPDMKLPYGQVKLIQEVAKVNPRTVVVIIAGSPVELAGIDNRVPAILWGWYNGMEGGNAIADVLSGKVNPSGKMPFTLPVSLEQSPAHALGNFPGRNLKVNYEEDILVGYRWFDTKNITPEYPFGYGLSYTQFKYDSLKVDRPAYSKDDVVKVSFTLKNTGKVAGAEVAQLYMSQPKASVLRPVKELKGFKKVWLQPGQEKRVELKVKVSDLAYYNEQSKSWIVESGRFEFLLGASSRDIRQQVLFNVR